MGSVLIVDDSLFLRHALKNIFETHGFSVVGMAEDGEEAVKLYQSLKPDLVTMDMTMPRLDGISALKAIRAMDPLAKVMMISAMGQELRVVESIQSGACGFVIKPFKEEQLLATVEKILHLDRGGS